MASLGQRARGARALLRPALLLQLLVCAAAAAAAAAPAAVADAYAPTAHALNHTSARQLECPTCADPIMETESSPVRKRAGWLVLVVQLGVVVGGAALLAAYRNVGVMRGRDNPLLAVALVMTAINLSAPIVDILGDSHVLCVGWITCYYVSMTGLTALVSVRTLRIAAMYLSQDRLARKWAARSALPPEFGIVLQVSAGAAATAAASAARNADATVTAPTVTDSEDDWTAKVSPRARRLTDTGIPAAAPPPAPAAAPPCAPPPTAPSAPRGAHAASLPHLTRAELCVSADAPAQGGAPAAADGPSPATLAAYTAAWMAGAKRHAAATGEALRTTRRCRACASVAEYTLLDCMRLHTWRGALGTVAALVAANVLLLVVRLEVLQPIPSMDAVGCGYSMSEGILAYLFFVLQVFAGGSVIAYTWRRRDAYGLREEVMAVFMLSVAAVTYFSLVRLPDMLARRRTPNSTSYGTSIMSIGYLIIALWVPALSAACGCSLGRCCSRGAATRVTPSTLRGTQARIARETGSATATSVGDRSRGGGTSGGAGGGSSGGAGSGVSKMLAASAVSRQTALDAGADVEVAVVGTSPPGTPTAVAAAGAAAAMVRSAAMAPILLRTGIVTSGDMLVENWLQPDEDASSEDGEGSTSPGHSCARSSFDVDTLPTMSRWLLQADARSTLPVGGARALSRSGSGHAALPRLQRARPFSALLTPPPSAITDAGGAPAAAAAGGAGDAAAEAVDDATFSQVVLQPVMAAALIATAHGGLPRDVRATLVVLLLCSNEGRRQLYAELKQEWRKQLFFFLTDLLSFVRRAVALDAIRHLAVLDASSARVRRLGPGPVAPSAPASPPPATPGGKACAPSPRTVGAAAALGAGAAAALGAGAGAGARDAPATPPAPVPAAAGKCDATDGGDAVRMAAPVAVARAAESPTPPVPSGGSSPCPPLAPPHLSTIPRRRSRSGSGGRRATGEAPRQPRRRALRSMLLSWVVSGDVATATAFQRYCDRRSPLYIGSSPATAAAVERAVAGARLALRQAAYSLSAPVATVASSGVPVGRDPLTRLLPEEVLTRLAALRNVFAAAAVEVITDIAGTTLASIMARPRFDDWRLLALTSTAATFPFSATVGELYLPGASPLPSRGASSNEARTPGPLGSPTSGTASPLPVRIGPVPTIGAAPTMGAVATTPPSGGGGGGGGSSGGGTGSGGETPSRRAAWGATASPTLRNDAMTTTMPPV